MQHKKLQQRMRIWFAGVSVLALLAGCNSRYLEIHREPPNAIPAAPARIIAPDSRPVVAIPMLQRADDDRRERDYTAIMPGAEMTLTSILQQKLTNRPELTLVDRRHVQQILGEQAVARSALVDPARRKKLGRQLSADYLLLGNVAAFRAPFCRLGRYSTRVQVAEVVFSLELVDVETGEVIWKVVHSGTGRRLLSGDAVRFEIDPVMDTIEENRQQDKTRLADLAGLAELLLDEALATLR